MTAIVLPNAGLKAGYLPLEDGWGNDMNNNLRLLDALLQAYVLDKDLTTPPATPTSGDLYIVPSGASGAWTSQTGKLAVWQTGDDMTGVAPAPAPRWVLATPRAGWRVWVADEAVYYQYSGSAWVAKPETDLTVLDIVTETGTSFTLGNTHSGKLARCTNAAAVTVTLPSNATTAFTVGKTLTLRQAGTGQLTIAPAGGVTLNVPTGYLARTGRRYATIMLHKVATDEWDITGDLGA